MSAVRPAEAWLAVPVMLVLGIPHAPAQTMDHSGMHGMDHSAQSMPPAPKRPPAKNKTPAKPQKK